MQFTNSKTQAQKALALLSALTLAHAASAATSSTPTQLVQNACPINLFYTTTNTSGTAVGPNVLYSGTALEMPIVGSGNNFVVHRDMNYFSASTAKMSLGTTLASDGVLYWALNDVNGDPLAGVGSFGVASSPNNVCGSARGYSGNVSACQTQGVQGGVQLVLNLCD